MIWLLALRLLPRSALAVSQMKVDIGRGMASNVNVDFLVIGLATPLSRVIVGHGW